MRALRRDCVFHDEKQEMRFLKTSGQKKVEFFLVKLLFPSAGPAKKKPPGIPGYSIVIKTFFSWYPCSPCGVKFKYYDQFVEQYSYALRGMSAAEVVTECSEWYRSN